MGISIVESLASGDRVFSVLPHDLVARAGSRCSFGYFWKHFSFSFILLRLPYQSSSLKVILALLPRPSDISVGVGIFHDGSGLCKFPDESKHGEGVMCISRYPSSALSS